MLIPQQTRHSAIKLCFTVILTTSIAANLFASDSEQENLNSSFRFIEDWLQVPHSDGHLGESHGDIAISESGDVYISVEGPQGGVQVYNQEGEYLRTLPYSPRDLHGFIIHKDPDGIEYIYGTRMFGESIVKMTLEGKLVMMIPASTIPKWYKRVKNGELYVYLTGIAVASNGDIYIVDGYGADYIHRYDAEGNYIETFGGRADPWSFNICHKIAMDQRYQPERLTCLDRRNRRIVQMNLEGEVLNTLAENLKLPSAIAFYGDEMAVAEIEGRVALFDKSGKLIHRLGENESLEDTNSNEISPDKWQSGVFSAPHGIAYDAKGNLYITEWSKWGRVLRFNRSE